MLIGAATEAQRGVGGLVDWLARLSGGPVFLVPGSQIEPLTGAIATAGALTAVVACHELGAGYMADGFARAGARTAVCLGIGGPGAANLLPAAVTARADASPVLFLTGDVPTSLSGWRAFQDAGAAGTRDGAVFEAALGASVRVASHGAFAAAAERVQDVLASGRPAHLAIPYDVQQALLARGSGAVGPTPRPPGDPLPAARAVAERLRAARRPVLLVGRGLAGRGGPAALRALLATCPMPVATTYDGKGILAEDDPLSVGVLGHGGSSRAMDRVAAPDTDLVLGVGVAASQRDLCDWDPRVIGDWGRWVVVGRRESRRGPPVGSRWVVEDVVAFVRALGSQLPASRRGARAVVAPAGGAPEPYPEHAGAGRCAGDGRRRVRLADALAVARAVLPAETVLLVDSGVHRAIAGSAWQTRADVAFFSAATLAPMGWAIGASIGVALARPGTPIVVVTGDGNMRMHAMEIATAARYELPIVFLVSDNESYAAVEQRARGAAAAAAVGALPRIDWAGLADSLGACGRRVLTLAQLDGALRRALRERRPSVIEVPTDPRELPLTSLDAFPAAPGG